MIFNDLTFFYRRTVCVRYSILNKTTLFDNKLSEELDAEIPTHLGTAYLKSLFVCVKEKKVTNVILN
jgi:hypothetical protein